MARWPWIAALIVASGALAGGYVLVRGPSSEGGRPVIRAVPDEAERTQRSEQAALLGSTASFIFHDAPRPVPDLAFMDGTGQTRSLSDLRGRAVVLNIWATWCVPCRREMPSLDRLQAQFDPERLVVLALSSDSAEAVNRFYEDFGVRGLGTYVYGGGGAASRLGLPGIPGTLLIDADGNEVGRKLGPAEWDSPEIVDVLSERFGLH